MGDKKHSRIIVIISIIWALVLASNLIPSLRGDLGWRWPYAFPPEHPERLLLLVLALSLYVVGARYLFEKKALIGWSLAGSIMLSLVILFVAKDNLLNELFARTASNATTGWHYAAADIEDRGGLNAALRDWPGSMLHYSASASHVSTAPPGIPILYSLANRLLERLPGLADGLGRPLRASQCHNYGLMAYSNAQLASAWLGMLTPLWASLSVLPMFWLGKRLYSEQAACWSAIWWPLVPAFVMFTPVHSTIHPFLSLVFIALLAEGLHSERPQWIIAAGLLMSVLSFMTFAFLPVLFMAGVLTLVTYFADRAGKKWHWPFRIGAWFGIGLSTVWLLYWALYGVSLFDIFETLLIIQRDMHATLDHPYLPWLALDLNDFFMFAGWPASLLALLSVWTIIQAWRAKQPLSRGQQLTLAAFITLLALDLSGVMRGESGRVWLFLTPFIILMAADWGAKYPNWWVAAAQASMVFTLVTFVHVIDSGLSDAPQSPPPLQAHPQEAYLPGGVLFGDNLHLTEFAGHIEDETLILWLNWQSGGQLDRTYYLSLIPVSPQGQPTEAVLVQPFGQAYPMTCWFPESGLIQDRIEISIPPSADFGGEWWASLSVIDGDTGQKLPVTLPDASQDDQAGLGPFR